MCFHKAIVRRGNRCVVKFVPSECACEGDLIVEPEKVSICGTDIQILRRVRDDPALIIGHEGLSRIFVKGQGVHGFERGDRVSINPTDPANPDFLLGHNLNGLLQEQVRIPAAAVAAGLVTHVSSSIPAARGTLIEPLAVVLYALECLELEHPDSLLIVGDGLIGNFASLVCPYVFDDKTPIAMMHRSELGFEWTHSFNSRVLNAWSVGEASMYLGGRVALLLATHRSGTEPLLTESARVLGSRLVAVHLVGGLPFGSVSSEFPGIDLHKVRMMNTGGGWPPSREIFSDSRRATALTGNRGVTTTQLVNSSVLLQDSNLGLFVDGLITHDCGTEEGVEILNKMIGSGSRVIDGSLVMRLVISV